MKRKFYVVGSDPGEVFDHIDELRKRPAERKLRPRETQTFARIPHDKVLALLSHHLEWAAWHVLFELDRAILKAQGRNPVRLPGQRLQAAGMHPRTKRRALRQLEKAGIITIRAQGPGRSPLIVHSWYEIRS
jgi:hypothetical protein